MDGVVKAVCRLCDDPDIEPVFTGPIRAGTFGTISPSAYQVMACPNCGVQYLEPFAQLATDYYADGHYRRNYNQTGDHHLLLKSYDDDQCLRLNRIGTGRLRGKAIGDFGCSAGNFLDLAAGVAQKTIAVEPFEKHHEALRAGGHRVFQWAGDVPAQSLDVAVSFDVVEHVAEPVRFLSQIYRSLKNGGIAHVTTPNRSEILMQIHADGYRTFYYRTAHLWYFEKKSLSWAMTRAGFKGLTITYRHKYDLSNLLCWLKDNRPTGCGQFQIFDRRLNDQWRDFLEEKGLADDLWITAHK